MFPRRVIAACSFAMALSVLFVSPLAALSISPVSKKALKIDKGEVSDPVVLATVSDDETPAGDLIVTVLAPPNWLQVSNIVNINGTVTAVLFATCTAPNGRDQLTLEVSDGINTSQTDISIIVRNGPSCR